MAASDAEYIAKCSDETGNRAIWKARWENTDSEEELYVELTSVYLDFIWEETNTRLAAIHGLHEEAEKLNQRTA